MSTLLTDSPPTIGEPAWYDDDRPLSLTDFRSVETSRAVSMVLVRKTAFALAGLLGLSAVTLMLRHRATPPKLR